MADKESEIFNANGDRLKIPGSSIKPATKLERGTVKQGESVPKAVELDSGDARMLNNIIQSLRDSGAIDHDQFVLFYHANFPADYLSRGGYDEYDDWDKRRIPADDSVYSTGDSAILKFEDDDKGNMPQIDGYDFIGWSRNKNATTPEFTNEVYEEGTEQSVTFENDDIVLYAVWRERTCTLTYALGNYGSGSVPSAQTVVEGDEVEVAGSPAPTVNDGSGRVFIGWSTGDGGDEVQDVGYSSGEHIYLYGDTTLYPVFAARYTLTYALGNDATGSVPSAQTAYSGETIGINFNPSVTCISDNTKVFIGWSTTDENYYADYEVDGANSIYMSGNVTLYPVFGEQQQQQQQSGGSGNALTIDLTRLDISSNVTVAMQQYYSMMNMFGPVGMPVSGGNTGTNSIVAGNTYRVKVEGSNYDRAIFTGFYDGVAYSNESLNINTHSDDGAIVLANPSDSSSMEWEFTSGDGGTIEFQIK